jgi:hypothetical protein
MKQEGAHQNLHRPLGTGQIAPLSASGPKPYEGRADEYVAPIEAARHLDKKQKASDFNRALSAFPHMTASAICLC